MLNEMSVGEVGAEPNARLKLDVDLRIVRTTIKPTDCDLAGRTASFVPPCECCLNLVDASVPICTRPLEAQVPWPLADRYSMGSG